MYDTTNDDGTYDLVDLDTEAKASNAFDDTSGTNLLAVVWKYDSYIQERDVSTSAGTVSSLTVSSAFDTNPPANGIWALKEEKDEVTISGSKKEYKVLAINQEDDNIFAFSCVEH